MFSVREKGLTIWFSQGNGALLKLQVRIQRYIKIIGNYNSFLEKGDLFSHSTLWSLSYWVLKLFFNLSRETFKNLFDNQNPHAYQGVRQFEIKNVHLWSNCFTPLQRNKSIKRTLQYQQLQVHYVRKCAKVRKKSLTSLVVIFNLAN